MRASGTLRRPVTFDAGGRIPRRRRASFSQRDRRVPSRWSALAELAVQEAPPGGKFIEVLPAARTKARFILPRSKSKRRASFPLEQVRKMAGAEARKNSAPFFARCMAFV